MELSFAKIHLNHKKCTLLANLTHTGTLKSDVKDLESLSNSPLDSRITQESIIQMHIKQVDEIKPISQAVRPT